MPANIKNATSPAAIHSKACSRRCRVPCVMKTLLDRETFPASRAKFGRALGHYFHLLPQEYSVTSPSARQRGAQWFVGFPAPLQRTVGARSTVERPQRSADPRRDVVPRALFRLRIDQVEAMDRPTGVGGEIAPA